MSKRSGRRKVVPPGESGVDNAGIHLATGLDFLAEEEAANRLREFLTPPPVLPGGFDARLMVGLIGQAVRMWGGRLPGSFSLLNEYLLEEACRIGQQLAKNAGLPVTPRERRKPSASSPRQKRLAKSKGKPRTRAAAKVTKPRAK